MSVNVVANNNYHTKLIGLCLLKTTNIDEAIISFADVLKLSITDARKILYDLKKNHLLLSNSILEKYKKVFIIHDSKESSYIDKLYLNSCHEAKRASLERAMNMLKESR